jgi:hypothetical protein
MAKLTMGQRKKIPKSKFAIKSKAPKSGSYPIHDRKHAKAALGLVGMHGSPSEKARVRAAVAKKYPGMVKKGKSRGKK